MADVRDFLAIVLGALIGLVLLVAPRVAFQLSVAGGTQNRHGEYGTDSDVPGQYVLLICALGVVCLGIAGYIAYGIFL